jgi:hypothetical protein
VARRVTSWTWTLTESRSPLGRDWRPDEREHIESTPGKWARTAKLTPEAIREIRRRTDSLSIPWTLEELARDYGVSKVEIAKIARRQRWTERVHEPEGRPYWRERERQ